MIAESPTLKTLPEIAKLVGLSYSTLWSHYRGGKLPPPTLFLSGRSYWDATAVRAIVKQYAGRPKWSRV